MAWFYMAIPVGSALGFVVGGAIAGTSLGRRGAFLVVVILYCLLGNLRAALTVALVLPLSVLFTFLMMRLTGVSANLMSLGRLAIAIGILVDAAVVVVENVHAQLARAPDGVDRLHLIYRATLEVATPVLSGVLIIIVVSLPLFALSGLEGKMFAPLALTICFALVGSLVRLKYRYLDLRRPRMQGLLGMRHAISQAARSFLNAEGFLEVETPVLTKSRPEGARDYLVPSRVNAGQFFALPQSPQLFKQVLMVSGVDRYYQIARCFRDEDLRNDRQPEFTQIDLELSFVDRDQVMAMMERMIVALFTEAGGVQLPTPFPRMTYREAMGRYGSDKPDLRFDMPLYDVTAFAAASDFKVFKDAATKGGIVKGLIVKGGASLSRTRIDALVCLQTSALRGFSAVLVSG